MGRVFASKGEQLVQNASELPANQFARWAMAAKFGMVSLAAVFWTVACWKITARSVGHASRRSGSTWPPSSRQVAK